MKATMISVLHEIQEPKPFGDNRSVRNVILKTPAPVDKYGQVAGRETIYMCSIFNDRISEAELEEMKGKDVRVLMRISASAYNIDGKTRYRNNLTIESMTISHKKSNN